MLELFQLIWASNHVAVLTILFQPLPFAGILSFSTIRRICGSKPISNILKQELENFYKVKKVSLPIGFVETEEFTVVESDFPTVEEVYETTWGGDQQMATTIKISHLGGYISSSINNTRANLENKINFFWRNIKFRKKFQRQEKYIYYKIIFLLNFIFIVDFFLLQQ